MQQRRIIRARDLAAFREALIELSLEGSPRSPRNLDARRRAVIVPTRASAELLRQTIESRLGAGRPEAVVLPDFLTRVDLIERFHAAITGSSRLLSRAEREVLLERAARRTARRPRMRGAPFGLRPGLVTAMLDLYDELRRRQRTVRRFAEALFQQLKGEQGTDRGSEGLIHQTAFLGFSFLAYERAVAATGACDEHSLRLALLDQQPALPHTHLVIAVADHPSDLRGLWPADFDLLGRLRHLARIDIVVTDAAHDAGFRDRVDAELPGIEEDRRTAAYPSPILIRPAGGGADGNDGNDGNDANDANERSASEPRERSSTCPPESLLTGRVERASVQGVRGQSPRICFVSRDREEELREVARAIRERAAATDGVLRDRTAVVFHRPLPYLYLSQQVLTEARVPYQAFDALPLAAEPYAALLDLVMTAARTGGTRESSVALLRTRLLRLEVDGVAVTAAQASALDQKRPRESFSSKTSPGVSVGGAAVAARAAAAAAEALRGFRDDATAAGQVRTLIAFLRQHECLPAAADPRRERHLRARAAVLGALEALAEAYERHDNEGRRHEDIASAIHHAIESQTFTPARGATGVHLVDAVAARFGEFDHVHLVGLVETDWPERPRRNIFYTAGLLNALGWPQQPDQARVERAAFTDLLALPAKTLQLSAFQLEGDSIVALSPMVELARDTPAVPAPPPARRRVFDDEVVTTAPATALAAQAPARGPASSDAADPAAWLRLRHARPDMTGPDFGGSVGTQAPQRYRVSRVDHYVDCPFKYFAENVLRLPEERDDTEGLTPLERGTLIHSLFEQFYRDWDRDPGGAITAATLPEALARFTKLTEDALAVLPEADGALERTRLLGSLVARGIAERVFELEVDAGGDIDHRLLEQDLKGPFIFPQLGGLKQRAVEIHGKADRIDVFKDGSIRVVDYKLSRLPDTDESVQIAVYAHAARQVLELADKRPYRVGAAMYLAFGDENKFEGSLGNTKRLAADVVEARVGVFAGIIDQIEAGEFPPRPLRTSDCLWCRYAGVCRKEYRAETETDEAAEPV